MSSPRLPPALQPLLLRVPDAAVLLGVSEREVWDTLRRGDLVRITIPGKRMTRIAREDLDRLVNQWRRGVS